MTQEDKQLLLKVLCEGLSYFENWVQYEGKDYIVTGYGHGRVSLLPSLFSSIGGPYPLIEEVKPYLRPMSSMTEKEKEDFGIPFTSEGLVTLADTVECMDWLNEHHFDFRGLIEKGLALEAPEDMYKEK